VQKQAHIRLGGGGGSKGGDVASFVEDTSFHITDVAGAFFYTMWDEVPTVPLAPGSSARKALAGFLAAVRTSLPGLKADVLLAFVQDSRSELGPVEWKAKVKAAEIPYARRGSDIVWHTCRGSAWKYRGFPCGMWLLYHAMLANDGGAPDAAAAFAKLLVIREYVLHFFTCADCRMHFSQFVFDSRQDAAVQLWRAHNAVNRRLAPVTEGADPRVPKVQFPTREQCLSCFNGGDYLESEVLHFLRARYAWNASLLNEAEFDCDSSGDVCLLKSDPGTGPVTPVPAFRRLNRDPNFTFRIDDSMVNVLATSMVMAVAVAAGYVWGVRRARNLSTQRHRRRE
jgi:hypothetical protein